MTEDTTDRVGQQIGNYRLIKLLGQGASADVYLGEHTLLKTQVAIKLLRVRLTNNLLKDFLNEAQTVASLKHPHIVRVFEGNVEDGIPYLVMDYLPGGTLREHYPRGTQLPPTQVAFFVEQIADALYYAHRQKLIHRDVKPENILVDADGHLLLSDFGLALIAQNSSSQIAKGVAGTVPYMAPEQLQGRLRFASDQYALGIMAYEWLTGERPFKGSFVEIASQHVLVPPSPLREKVPALPEAVEQAVLKALAKEPVRRFSNTIEFAHALTQASIDLSYLPTALLSWPDRPSFQPPMQQVESMGTPPISQINPSTLPPISGNTSQSDASSLANFHRSRESPDQPLPARPYSFSEGRKKTSRLFVFLAILALVVLVMGSVFYLTRTGPSTTPPILATATPTVVVAQGQVTFLDSPDKAPGTTDALKITATNLPNPPDGSEYDAWFIDTANEQVLSLGSLRKSDPTTFTLSYPNASSPPQTNLLSAGNKIEITQEQGNVTEPSGKIILTVGFPPQAFVHIRHLLVSFPATPANVALLTGLLNETQKVNALSVMLQNSATSGNTASVTCIAQAMINVIEGKAGQHYRSLATDCARVGIGDAVIGDGFGILGDGKNGGYVPFATQHAALATSTSDATDTLRQYAKDVETSTDSVQEFMTKIDNDALQFLTNPPTVTQIRDMVSLSEHAYQGFDQNGDGKIEPIAGEAGAITAYTSGQLMATLNLSQ